MKTTKMEADPTAQAAGLPAVAAPPTLTAAQQNARPQAFAETMLRLRLQFKFSCSSWGRTPAHNKAVGGVPNSHHLTWTAMDCVLDDPIHDSVKFVEAAHAAGLQADCSDKDHIHLEVP